MGPVPLLDSGEVAYHFCHVRTPKRPLSVNQEVGPQQTLNLLALRSWTSQPPKLQEGNVFCLSHPGCGIFVKAAGTDGGSVW